MTTTPDTEVNPSRPLYLVATDDGEDDAYAVVRRAAVQLAKEHDASIVLYDRSAESHLTEPYPGGVMSEDEDAVGPTDQLEPDVLEGLGRAYLAEQLRAVRADGVEAYAYLAQGTGAQAIAEATERFRPDLVLLSQRVEDIDLADRFADNTPDDISDEVVEGTGTKVRVVEADGTVRPLED